MRLKPQYLFVVVVAGLVALYFIGRSLLSLGAPATARTESQARPAAGPPSVQAKLVPEVVRAYDVVVRGRTQATRVVVVRSETAGVVAQTPVLQGTFVKQGQVLCRLAVDARQAALDQNHAAERSAELNQQQNEELAKRGFRSPAQVLQGQANLDAAKAAVRQAEIALAQVNIKAPFAGVFYPVSVLPRWMRAVSRLLPPSYVFESLRAIAAGKPPSFGGLWTGALLSVLAVAFAYGVFAATYGYAVRTGLIARYSAETVS